VDTDDFCTIMAVLETKATLNVTMSYLDRIVRREIVVNCEDVTIQADLITGTVRINGTVETFPVERDATYLALHRAMLHGDLSTVCTLDHGLKVVETIGLVESAQAQDVWLAG
jgi:hypothetical protein